MLEAKKSMKPVDRSAIVKITHGQKMSKDEFLFKLNCPLFGLLLTLQVDDGKFDLLRFFGFHLGNDCRRVLVCQLVAACFPFSEVGLPIKFIYLLFSHKLLN